MSDFGRDFTDSSTGKQKNSAFWETALSFSVAFFLAARNISLPGLYYDEVLFVNAARGGSQDMFIRERLFGIPVLLMDYIGALKAWLYYPVFSFFEVSPGAVRYPAIIAGLLGGYFAIRAVEVLTQKRCPWWALCLVLCDPTLLIQSRLDWGPNALAFLFRGLLLYSLSKLTFEARPKHLYFAGLWIALGLFEKLNFIWVAVPFVGAFFTIYPSHLLKCWKASPKHTAAALMTLGAVLGLALWRAVDITLHMAPESKGWPQRWSEFFGLMRLQVSGGGAVDFIVGTGNRSLVVMSSGFVVLAIVAALSARKMPTPRPLIFLGLSTLGVLAMVFATKTATGPHHIAIVSALPQIVLLPAIMQSSQAKDRLSRSGVRFACIGVALIFIAVSFVHVRWLMEPKHKNWDPANFVAAQMLANETRTIFVSDWGIANQIAGTVHPKVPIHDSWPTFRDTEAAKALLKSRTSGANEFVMVTHVTGQENFSGGEEAFLKVCQEAGWQASVETELKSIHGQPLVRIWGIKK